MFVVPLVRFVRVVVVCLGVSALVCAATVPAFAAASPVGASAVAALLASGPMDPTAVAAAGGSASSVPLAVAAARVSGAPVLVSGMSSPTRVAVANPDGTVTEDLATRPRWGQAVSGGGWSPVDFSLVASASGWVPRVAGVPVVLSAGGAGAFASTSGPGWSYSERLLDAPFLPVPVVSGGTATYVGVLPGVDLVVRATSLGFSEQFLLRRAQVAGFRIRVGIDLTGNSRVTTLASTTGIQVVDASGKQLAVAGSPLMWDGASGSDEAPGLVATTLFGSAPSAELDLVPDASYLAAPTRVWPITVDPDISRPSGCATGACYDTRVDNGVYANTSFWTDAKLELGHYAGTNTNESTFLKFDTSALVGSTISAASLWLYQNGSSCGFRGWV